MWIHRVKTQYVRLSEGRRQRYLPDQPANDDVDVVGTNLRTGRQVKAGDNDGRGPIVLVENVDHPTREVARFVVGRLSGVL